MGIIAWIVLGLGAGLLANMLIPGRRSQGLILTCVIGVAGALLRRLPGDQVVPRRHPARVQRLHLADRHAGSAVLLLAYQLVTSGGSPGRTRRRAGWAHR